MSANSSFISHQIRNLSVLFASILQEEENKPIKEEIEPQIKKQLLYNFWRVCQTNWQTTIFIILIVTDMSTNSSFISYQIDMSANSSFISHLIRNLSVLLASILQDKKNKPIKEEIEP